MALNLKEVRDNIIKKIDDKIDDYSDFYCSLELISCELDELSQKELNSLRKIINNKLDRANGQDND